MVLSRFVAWALFLVAVVAGVSVNFLPPLPHSGSFVIGQQIVVEVEAAEQLNSSSVVQIRLIAAFVGRAHSGSHVALCNSSAADSLDETSSVGWEVSAPHRVRAAFIVPSVPFRVCVSVDGASFRDPSPYGRRGVVYVNASQMSFESAALMIAGDFAAIEIRSHYAASLSDGDSLTFVPRGALCSAVDDCDGTFLNGTGRWRVKRCAGAAALIGTRSFNPRVEVLHSAPLDVSAGPVAYAVLPAAGIYDVCFSPLEFRKRWIGTRAPAWLKLKSSITVAAASVADVRWVADDESPGTWGGLVFRGSSLNSNAATSWEFTSVVGGDVFRLVRVGSAAGCWDRSGGVFSSDLGASPRTSDAAHLSNATEQSEVAAFIQFPSGPHHVCYRKAGKHNWRAIPHVIASRSSVLDGTVQTIHGSVSFRLNDTRGGTWAELEVSSTIGGLFVTPSNYFSAASVVRSTGARIVRVTDRCDTGPSVFSSWNPGSPSCTPDECSFQADCGLGQCFGRLDDGAAATSRVSFFFTVPADASTYRVCVKVGTFNWNSVGTFTASPAPVVTYSVTDRRANGRTAVVFRVHGAVSSPGLHVSRAARRDGGDTVRIIPRLDASTGEPNRCDLTWKAGDNQAYSPRNTATDLGIFCGEGKEAAFPVLCNVSRRTSGVNPHTNFVVDADGIVPAELASVAWLTLPPSPGLYTVCYRQQLSNWIEAPESLSVVAGPSCGLTSPPSTIFAGSRVTLSVSCGGATAINASTSALKLVSTTCEFAAAGTVNVASQHASATFSTSGSITQVSNTTVSGTMTAPFHLPRGQEKSFTVCFMDRFAPNMSWFEAGRIAVVDNLLTASVVSPASTATLRHQQAVTFVVTAPTAFLDTRPGRNSLALVRFEATCGGNETWPPGGSDDLGEADTQFSTTATFQVTLPPSAVSVECYKVCFRSVAADGAQWLEVPLTNFERFCASTPRVTTLHVDPRFAVDKFIAGSSSFWDFAVGNVLSVDGRVIFNSNVAFLTLDGTVDPVSDRFAFVMSSRQCASGESEVSAASPTASAEILLDLPVSPGRYLACLRMDGLWHQLRIVNGSNPSTDFIDLEPSLLEGAAQSASIVVEDLRTALITGRTVSAAAVAPSDVVYFTSASSVCGTGTAFDGGDLLGAVSRLTLGAGGVASISRWSAANASRIPAQQQGRYKLCYFRTTDARVNGSAELAAFVPRNMWYHITFNGLPLLDTTVATALQLSCPPTLLVNGQIARFTVTFVTSSGGIAQPPHRPTLVTINATGFDASLVGTSACAGDNGLSLLAFDALPIHVALLPLTRCTSNICRVSVHAPGTAESNSCDFSVVRTSVASLRVVGASFDVSCDVGSACTVSIAAQDATGGVAYATDDAITVVTSTHPGLEVGAASEGPMLGGVITVRVRPALNASEASLWTQPRYTVVINVSAGAALVSHQLLIERPSVAALIIADVHPVSISAGGVASYLRSLTVPDWQPTASSTATGGVFVPSAFLSSIVSSGGHFLVAAQYYRVQLCAVDRNDRLVPDPFVAGTPLRVALHVNNDTAFDANAVYGLPQSADFANLVHDTTPMTPITVSKSEIDIVFKVRNANGCMSAMCNITFAIGGSDSITATLSTSVRSPAVALRVACAFAGSAEPPSLSRCTSATTVERGVILHIEAIDQFGVVDVHYAGHAVALLHQPPGTDAEVVHIDDVSSGARISPVVALSAGRAVWHVSLTRPCPKDCTVTLAATLGANAATVPVVVEPSSRQLHCRVTSSVFRERIDGDVELITDADFSRALLYPDTEICIDVDVRASNGAPTRYESLWATYHVQSLAASAPVSTRETQQLRPRVQRLSRSAATFCFAASSTAPSALFSVSFVVQRFGVASNGAPHWTQQGGSCIVAGLRAVQQKVPARLTVLASSGDFTELPTAEFRAPSPTVWVWAQHPPPASAVRSAIGVIETSVGFVDHYGRLLDFNAASRAPLLTGASVTVEGCPLATLVATPPTCAGAAVSAQHAIEDGGVVSVVPTVAQTGATSGVRFRFAIRGFCLRCSVSFSLLRANGTVMSGMGAQLFVTWLLPAASPRVVGFPAGRSPLRMWPTIPLQCMTAGATCLVNVSTLPTAACDRRTAPTVLGGIELTVFSTVAASASASLSPLGEPQCGGGTGQCTAATAQHQVDVFSTFSLAVSMGNQRLRCATGRCDGDHTTNIRITVPSAGLTPVEAVLQLRFPLRSVVLSLVGLLPSGAHQDIAADGTTALSSAQAVGGALRAQATFNSSIAVVEMLETAVAVVWKGPREPSGVRFLDAARESTCAGGITYPSASLSESTGYVVDADLDSMNFSYAATAGTSIAPNVYFPVTVELHDEQGDVAALNAGEIVITKRVARGGCGTGGELLVRGGSAQSLQSGRVVFWVALTDTCEACELVARLNPGSSPAFARLATLTARLTAISHRIRVVASRAANPANPLLVVTRTTLPSETSVGAALNVTLNVIGVMGGSVPIDVADATTGEVHVYNKIMPVSGNVIVAGNGGILKPFTTAGVVWDRGATKMRLDTSSRVVSVAFQRSCAACAVAVRWSLSSGHAGHFTMRSNSAVDGTRIRVIAAPMLSPVILGSVPRVVARNTLFAYTLANAASDAAGIAVDAPAPLANISVEPGRRLNGDGGAITSRTIPVGGLTLVVLSASDPCDDCHVRFAEHIPRQRLVITTRATHLRTQSVAPTRVTPGSDAVFASLYASDDNGFVDVTAGGPSDCALFAPFTCTGPRDRPVITATASANGATPFGFDPTLPHFHAGGSDAAFVISLRDNQLVDGLARLQMNFTSPVRSLVPIFRADALQITSALRGGALSDAARAIDVVISDTSSATLALRQDKVTFNSIQELVLDVGIVKALPLSTTRYVIATAANSVRATFSDTCGPGRAAVTVSAVKGIAVLRQSFPATPVGSPCRVTFTLLPGGGVTCDECTATVDLTIVTPPVVGWTWLRPSAVEHAGASAGPVAAAAGRRQFLEVGAVVQIDGQHVLDSRCTDCVLTVTSLNCGTSSPTFVAPVPSGGSAGGASSSIPFSGGRATSVLRWPAATARYSCGLRVTATIGGAVLPVASTSAASWEGVVTVCVPHHMHVLTNISSLANARGEIATGRVFPVSVEMREVDGRLCIGDSQEDATAVSVSVPVAERPSAIAVAVLNTNPALSSVLSDARPLAVNNEIRLIAGRYTFNLVITASARQARVSSVRLRFTARSEMPRIDQVHHTAPFVPVVAAARLRIRPDTQLPAFVVANRHIGDGGVVVEAVDNVFAEWLQYAPNAPNVASHASEFGNAASVEWTVDPLPTGVPFPLSFARGARVMSLTGGTGTAAFNFSGVDGTFSISVRSRETGISSTAPISVTVQSINAIGIAAANGGFCHSSSSARCNITHAAFNDTARMLTGQLLTKQESMFTVTAALLDPLGRPVAGDHTSVLALRIIKRPSSSTVTLRQCLGASGCGEGPFFATVRAGVATFDAVFSGTTHLNVFTHDAVQLEVLCPRLVDRINPCLELSLPPVRTNEIIVEDNKVVADVSAIIRANMPTFRVPLTAPSLTQFNITAFRHQILQTLVTSPTSQWPRSASTVDRIIVTVCELDVPTYGAGRLLRGNVCGASSMCLAPYDFSCPRGVRICSCPALPTAAQRFFADLQQGSISVVAELTFAIVPSDVVGRNIPALLSDVGFFLLRQLQTNSTFVGVNRNEVSLIANSDGPTTSAPPPPLTTPPPTGIVTLPPTSTPGPASVAPRVHFVGFLVISIAVHLAVVLL